MTDENGEMCGGCFHYHAPDATATGGTCWRYPPTAVAIPVQAPKAAIAVPTDRQGVQGAGNQGIMTFPVRPPVTADTPACGEWESADDEPDDGNGETFHQGDLPPGKPPTFDPRRTRKPGDKA